MRWLLLTLVLAGCATMTNTRAQDQTWAAFEECQRDGRVDTNIEIDRVAADGRYYWHTRTGSYGVTEFRNCMEEKFGRRPAARKE